MYKYSKPQKIFFNICDAQDGTIIATYIDKNEAHKHAQKSKTYFVCVNWE